MLINTYLITMITHYVCATPSRSEYDHKHIRERRNHYICDRQTYRLARQLLYNEKAKPKKKSL
jgi:hypothetical protein